MEKLALIVLVFFVPPPLYSQLMLDSSFEINAHIYQIILNRDENIVADHNTQLTIFKDNIRLMLDSVYCSFLRIDFDDVNEDGFKDLLVYEGSGARSNERYNLYLFNNQKSNFIKVENFNLWPNLFKTGARGLLCAKILTGSVEYKFFQLTDSGNLVDIKVSEIDSNPDGKAYESGSRTALKKINL